MLLCIYVYVMVMLILKGWRSDTVHDELDFIFTHFIRELSDGSNRTLPSLSDCLLNVILAHAQPFTHGLTFSNR